MNRRLVIVLVSMALIPVLLFGYYWADTQPVWSTSARLDETILTTLPARNQDIILFVEANGNETAPSYEEMVCTEFVIAVTENFCALSTREKNDIRIITQEDVSDLIEQSNPIIRGIQNALTTTNKAFTIERAEEVQPGDFVQFWNLYNGKAYGHCGIVMNIDEGKTLTLYSSHPLTSGYGKQTWLWPEYVYFARLR